jgi:hypothetical protein
MLLAAAFVSLPFGFAWASPIPFSPASPFAPGDSAVFGDPSITAGSFTDNFDFTVTAPSVTSSYVSDFFIPGSPALLNISSLVLKLFDGGTELATGAVVNGPPSDVLRLVYSGLLPSVTYTLRVTGTADGTGYGNARGAFSGVLSIAAVPLPPSVTLFLAALAGLAFLMFWRRQKFAR